MLRQVSIYLEGMRMCNNSMKTLIVTLIITFFSIWSVSSFGCIEQQQKPPLQKSALPAIEEFSENISSKHRLYSELKWNVTGANSIFIEPGIGLVESSGTRLVNTVDQETYVIIASNEVGTTRKAITVHCPYCEPRGLPKIKGYVKYIDQDNGFGFIYPISWIIDRQRFSDLNEQAGGTLTGVSITNDKPGSEFAYYDVLIAEKGPDFDKRAFANKYQEEQHAKGYTLVKEKTRQLADDQNGIMQYYQIDIKGHIYDQGVVFQNHAGKFWITRYEWPSQTIDYYNIPYSFSYLFKGVEY